MPNVSPGSGVDQNAGVAQEPFSVRIKNNKKLTGLQGQNYQKFTKVGSGNNNPSKSGVPKNNAYQM